MTIEINLEQIFRDAINDYLQKNPLTIQEPATQTEPETPRFYTRAQAAEVAQVSLPTLHALHNEGLVSFVKIGRSTRILADKFDADLAAGKFSNLRKRRRA